MAVVIRSFGRSDTDRILVSEEKIGDPQLADRRHMVSSKSAVEMARDAAARAIEAGGLNPEEIDTIIVASESFWDIPEETTYTERTYRAFRDELLGIFAHDLGLGHAMVIGLWMSACGNALPALDLAYSRLESSRSRNVLVVSTDRAREAARVMRSGLAVFSDVAAAAIVSNDGAGLDLLDVVLTSTPGLLRAHRTGDPVTMALELRKGLLLLDAAVKQRIGLGLSQMHGLMFENLRPEFVRAAADVLGAGPERIVVANDVPPGHAFSADLLLAAQALSGESGDGSRLVAAVSLASWTLGAAIFRF